MKTTSFCCFVGPRVRTTIVGVRGRRGRPGICIVSWMLSDAGTACGWNGWGVAAGFDGLGGLPPAAGWGPEEGG